MEIIQLLRSSNRDLPAHAIAETLGVAIHTVYRDIATLQGMRISIEGESGISSVMRPGFDLLLTFTPTDERLTGGGKLLRQDWLKQNPAFAPDADELRQALVALPT